MRNLLQIILAVCFVAVVFPSADAPAPIAHAARPYRVSQGVNGGNDPCRWARDPANLYGRTGVTWYATSNGNLYSDEGTHRGPGKSYSTYYACSDKQWVHNLAYNTNEAWCGTGSKITAWHFYYSSDVLNVDGPAFWGVYADHMWATVHSWGGNSTNWKIILTCEYT